MTHRQFRDDRGLTWDVFDGYPSAMELERRRQSRRRNKDRRVKDDGHSNAGVIKDLRLGWLAFQAGGERRRLVPIPPDWNSLPEDELRTLKERAVPAERPK
jgi:hypothetical protein